MICKDCVKFKTFEYKTHGVCTHQPLDKKVTKSYANACKYFSPKDKENRDNMDTWLGERDK